MPETVDEMDVAQEGRDWKRRERANQVLRCLLVRRGIGRFWRRRVEEVRERWRRWLGRRCRRLREKGGEEESWGAEVDIRLEERECRRRGEADLHDGEVRAKGVGGRGWRRRERETWVRRLLVRLRAEDGEGRRDGGPEETVHGEEERAGRVP